MTTNRLSRQMDDASRPIPPKGDSDADKAARQRFWIDHGNEKLVQAGQTHLHWVCVHGNYFIEERAETYRRTMLANPNYARAA